MNTEETIKKIGEIIPGITPEQAMAINNLIVKANQEGYDIGYTEGSMEDSTFVHFDDE